MPTRPAYRRRPHLTGTASSTSRTSRTRSTPTPPRATASHRTEQRTGFRRMPVETKAVEAGRRPRNQLLVLADQPQGALRERLAVCAGPKHSGRHLLDARPIAEGREAVELGHKRREARIDA